ncbi:hypothetical protein WJX79_008357 [Trebouxia sp. C0005]
MDGSHDEFFDLEEVEALAKKKLKKPVYDYYAGGADTESTVRDNRAVYARYRLLPRYMVDVSHCDMTYTLLGRKLRMPIIVAPMSQQRMANDEGELAVARAVAKEGTAMVLSTMATQPLEDVAKAGKDGPLQLFQLYVIKDRKFCKSLIQRAGKAGYAGFMVTVDAPRLGNRIADERNKFSLPPGMDISNLKGLEKGKGKGDSSSHIVRIFQEEVDASLTWEFVKWMREVTDLPVFVKGILSPEDARKAVDIGVDGIVVSNHGGRQLDYSPATLDMIAPIRAAIGHQVPLLMDGGIRRGTDVLKAIALGADAVMLGRPVLYGLALQGEEGVRKQMICQHLFVAADLHSLELCSRGCQQMVNQPALWQILLVQRFGQLTADQLLQTTSHLDLLDLKRKYVRLSRLIIPASEMQAVHLNPGTSPQSGYLGVLPGEYQVLWRTRKDALRPENGSLDCAGTMSSW